MRTILISIAAMLDSDLVEWRLGCCFCCCCCCCLHSQVQDQCLLYRIQETWERRNKKISYQPSQPPPSLLTDLVDILRAPATNFCLRLPFSESANLASLPASVRKISNKSKLSLDLMIIRIF